MGYYIQLSWHQLVIRTLETPDLKSAVEWHTKLMRLRNDAEHDVTRGHDLMSASMRFDCGEPFWFKMGPPHPTPFVRDLRRTHQMRIALEHTLTVDEHVSLIDSFYKELSGYRKMVSLRRKHLLAVVSKMVSPRLAVR